MAQSRSTSRNGRQRPQGGAGGGRSSRRISRHFFASALVSPVLTAHPTEVRRKSTIDREMEVSQILAKRDRQRLTPAEVTDSEEALRRAILTLWQTSILRRNRLKVIDEVMNGLSYYDYTFFEEIPAPLRVAGGPAGGDGPRLEYDRAAVLPAHGKLDRRRSRWKSFRDRRCAASGPSAAEPARAGFYLEQVNLLGGELSLDGTTWPCRSRRRRWRIHRPIFRRTGRTSPIAAPCRVSTRASRRPPPGWATRKSPVMRWVLPPPTRAPRNCQAISRSSIARCCRTARARSPVDGFAKFGAPSTCSDSILPASTCGRTPTCMSA